MTGPAAAEILWPPSVTVGVGVGLGMGLGAAPVAAAGPWLRAPLEDFPPLMNALYSCQRITAMTATARSDFQLSFGFFGLPAAPALLISLVSGLVCAGRSATSLYLGLLCIMSPFCSLLLNLIDRERHVSAGKVPYHRRVAVQRVEDPLLLAAGIVQDHCALHLVRGDDVIDVLPVVLEHAVPYLRVGCRIPVRLGVRIVGALVV